MKINLKNYFFRLAIVCVLYVIWTVSFFINAYNSRFALEVLVRRHAGYFTITMMDKYLDLPFITGSLLGSLILGVGIALIIPRQIIPRQSLRWLYWLPMLMSLLLTVIILGIWFLVCFNIIHINP